MSAFLISFLVIFIAELGDKSQLVALWFATKYRWWLVLAGVTAATLIVHLGSVAIGRTVDQLLPENVLLIIVGLSFFAFAAWSILGVRGQDAVGDGQSCGRPRLGCRRLAWLDAGDGGSGRTSDRRRYPRGRASSPARHCHRVGNSLRGLWSLRTGTCVRLRNPQMTIKSTVIPAQPPSPQEPGARSPPSLRDPDHAASNANRRK
jgi:hypothetical protein